MGGQGMQQPVQHGSPFFIGGRPPLPPGPPPPPTTTLTTTPGNIPNIPAASGVCPKIGQAPPLPPSSISSDASKNTSVNPGYRTGDNDANPKKKNEGYRTGTENTTGGNNKSQQEEEKS